jgi:hypothetical protein
MSDDEQPRRPDETSEFNPFADDEEESRPIEGPPKDDDATQVTPQAPRSDATSVLPAVDDGGTPTERYVPATANWADDDGPIWAGRAGVRHPRPGYDDDFTRTDWAAVPSEEEPRGKWWMPIVVGIVGLLLLGLLGWGIYLIVQSTGDDDTTPAVTPSIAPTATTEPATKPTTTAPATTEPTASPTPSPTDVTVPALKGLSSEEARAALDRKGLRYRLRFVTSDSPAGTVIDSDPAEGQQVPADTVITLIIAAAPTAPTTTATSEPTGLPDDD